MIVSFAKIYYQLGIPIPISVIQVLISFSFRLTNIWTSYEHNIMLITNIFVILFFSKQKTIKFIMRFHFFWFHYYIFIWTLLIIIWLITKSQLICVHHNWFSSFINLLSTLNSFPELFFPYYLLSFYNNKTTESRPSIGHLHLNIQTLILFLLLLLLSLILFCCHPIVNPKLLFQLEIEFHLIVLL